MEEPRHPDDEVWVLANEFAEVEIRRVRTGNGIRLSIRAPKLGYETLLDPVALETLTWQPPELFSRFLRSPFGPDSESE